MLKIIISLVTVVSLGLLVMLLNITTPVTAGPFGILAIFICSYLSLIGIVTFFIYGISKIIAHLSVALVSRKPFEALSFKRSYYFSTVIAAAPIMLIGIQSVGNVGLYEYLLMLVFIIIGCLYVSKKIS
ncbi:MAG: hypothetical protein WCK26_03720 [Candidatus Saccharibacteria bacterium]|jgi:hypothetical protein